MSSPERSIRAVAPQDAAESADVSARIADLEAEVAELRAETARLQDDLRWLAGVDDDTEEEPGFLSRGWLAAGWVRASLVLASVGIVSLVSLPYLSHLLDGSGAPDRVPVAAAESAPAVAPPRAAPHSTPREEYIPVPVHVPSTEIPAPARVSHTVPPPARPASARERSRPLQTPAGDADAPAPVRGESP
ncbi:MAG TPA: hypothetical protein VJ971_01865 [Methylomirabilota bacterium]|nr:hypothetical protein [Methylomirabilota bacterium]